MKSPIDKILIEENRPGQRSIRIQTALLKPFFWLSRLPLFSRLHPWSDPEKTDMRWLPVNEDIQLSANAPLPMDLLDRLIEEASHRVIIEECGCRVAFQCENYPLDIGCLLMGDSAIESSPRYSREVGIDEAKEHSRRAAECGLVPVVGKARVDNFIFGIKDQGRMLTVCYCCECCCITRFTRYARASDLDALFPRLEGVVLEVTDGCTGCGECVEHCYLDAIEIVDGKARMKDLCRACGRCAYRCPSGAIEIRIEDPEFLDKTYDRIRSYVEFD